MIALLAGGLLSRATGGCAGLEGSELQCEEAVARIVDCCGVRPEVSCSHYANSCGEYFPELDLAESRCIRDASCGDLEARGVCDWAATFPSPSATPSFCP